MKILLSLNYKFFKLEPKQLIELIKKYDKKRIIKGFEIATNSEDDEKYVIELSKIAVEENYIINLHSSSFDSLEKANRYIEFAVKISKITKRKLNIVYHPINAKNITESKEKTKKQIDELIKYIKLKRYLENIEISIENLNDINKIKRLKKEDLVEILERQHNLKFTYDIGHEIIEGIKTEKLVPELEERLNNIHIHTYKKKLDHYPIKNINDEKTIKKLLNKYSDNKTVVLEYALDYIEGDKFEIKLKNYIESAKKLDNDKNNFLYSIIN